MDCFPCLTLLVWGHSHVVLADTYVVQTSMGQVWKLIAKHDFRLQL